MDETSLHRLVHNVSRFNFSRKHQSTARISKLSDIANGVDQDYKGIVLNFVGCDHDNGPQQQEGKTSNSAEW